MKKFGKIMATVLASAISMSLFAGCSKSTAGSSSAPGSSGSSSSSSSSGPAVTLTYWHTHSDTEEKVLKEDLIPKFEKDNPNIKIKAVRMPYDGLKQQLIQAVASGTAPDLMRIDIIWTPEFAKMGALVDVDSEPNFSALKDSFFTGPLSTNAYGGKYYGVPYDTNTISGIYSKAMLKQLGLTSLPTTLDQVAALKSKLKSGQYLMACDGANTWSLAPYFYSLGGTYTDPTCAKASGYFNSDASIKAMETISQWYDQKIFSPAMLGGKPDKANSLFKGQALFGLDGPWFYSSNKATDLANVEFGEMPAGSAGSISVVGGEDLVLFNSGKHNAEAWTYAQFLVGEYAQKTMAIKAGLIPTVKSVANEPDVMATPNMPIFVKQLDSAVARTPSPAWEQMSDKIGTCFEAIIRHKEDAKTAMNELAPELDALLAQK